MCGREGMGEAPPAPAGRRAMCGACLRPARVCLCAFFPPAGPVDTPRGTRVVILQHPLEAKKTLGTARYVAHVLRRAAVVKGRRLRRASAEPGSAAADVFRALDEGTLWVLFPGPGAAPMCERARESDGASEQVQKGLTLLLFDGTWREGKQMFNSLFEDGRDGAAFRRCPLVYLSPACLQRPLADAGRLRVEPAPGCVSTLEAVAEALFHVEGGGAAASRVRAALVGVYDALVNFQVDSGAPHMGVRREKDAGRDLGKQGV